MSRLHDHQALHHQAHLKVVFVQYDRQKYPTSLERLLGLLDRLQGIDSEVVVVDNANPGDWCHQVSPNLVQIGGDNSAWEFSAFDRGLAFLSSRDASRHDTASDVASDRFPSSGSSSDGSSSDRRGSQAEIYAFATDAFMAYGNDPLRVIDDETLAFCLEVGAVVGWIESSGENFELFGHTYHEWLRTSLFFIPAPLLHHVLPIETQFDPAVIFGPTAEHPLADGASTSPNLRARILAWLTQAESTLEAPDVRHSRIDLNPETFDFFKAKTCAVLQEHLLSIRLRQAGLLCYDVRFLRQLEQERIEVPPGNPRREISDCDSKKNICVERGLSSGAHSPESNPLTLALSSKEERGPENTSSSA